MKKNIFIALTVILVVFLFSAGLVLVKKRKQAIADSPPAMPVTYTVATALPETRTVTQTRTFLARLESANIAEISSRLSGRITQLLVSESRKVRKGDLLLRIDDTEIRADIAGLRARLLSARRHKEYAEKQQERNTALYDTGGLAREKLDASEVEYDRAAADVKELEQRIKGLENQLSYCNIRAPFDGITGTVFLRSGSLAVPGRPVLLLNSIPQKLTFGFIPSSVRIEPGMDILWHGSRIGKTDVLYNDAVSGLWVAEARPDRRIDQPSGSYVTVRVVTGTGTGCAVPVGALLHGRDKESVMIYENGRFRKQGVTVTVRNNEFAVIRPRVALPVAVASESKLALLAFAGRVGVRVIGVAGGSDE